MSILCHFEIFLFVKQTHSFKAACLASLRPRSQEMLLLQRQCKQKRKNGADSLASYVFSYFFLRFLIEFYSSKNPFHRFDFVIIFLFKIPQPKMPSPTPGNLVPTPSVPAEGATGDAAALQPYRSFLGEVNVGEMTSFRTAYRELSNRGFARPDFFKNHPGHGNNLAPPVRFFLSN